MSNHYMQILAMLMSGFDLSLAVAGPCSEEIARTENAMSPLGGDPGPSPQSIDTHLHRQATPNSATRAQDEDRCLIHGSDGSSTFA